MTVELVINKFNFLFDVAFQTHAFQVFDLPALQLSMRTNTDIAVDLTASVRLSSSTSMSAITAQVLLCNLSVLFRRLSDCIRAIVAPLPAIKANLILSSLGKHRTQPKLMV